MQTRSYPHIRLRSFALAYEDLPAFHAAYFMLVLIFAGLCDLGFFALLIGFHLVVDFLKYRYVLNMSYAKVIAMQYRENLTDVALFLLGLSAYLYLNAELPMIAGLTGAAATRVTIIRGGLVLLPKLTILHHTLRMVFSMHEHLHSKNMRPKAKWSVGERTASIIFILSFFALVAASFILSMSVGDIVTLLMPELIPWSF